MSEEERDALKVEVIYAQVPRELARRVRDEIHRNRQAGTEPASLKDIVERALTAYLDSLHGAHVG